MKPELKVLLFDVKTAINSIEDYLKDTSDFEDFMKNKMLRRAVERELEIIGEAINAMMKIDQKIPISDARKIVDTRNWIIHGYNQVDYALIWSIVNFQIPTLKEDISHLI